MGTRAHGGIMHMCENTTHKYTIHTHAHTYTYSPSVKHFILSQIILLKAVTLWYIMQ